MFWEVFFLVPTGRGAVLQGLTGPQCEDAFRTIHAVQRRGEFVVKVTEAPHYRRFVAQQAASAGNGNGVEGLPAAPIRLGPKGVNAGNGFLFVSHVGEIYPSGFLPLSVGNVRTYDLAAAYRTSGLFRDLRDPDRFQGPCGRCEFRHLCGGSRSRAHALTGDPLGSDPWCVLVPGGTLAGE